jgi:hypothetical protein
VLALVLSVVSALAGGRRVLLLATALGLRRRRLATFRHVDGFDEVVL